MNGFHKNENGQISIGMIAVGLIVIAFGTLLLMNNLGVAETRHLWRQFWPVSFVAIGAAILSQPGKRGGRWWGMVWIAAGLWIYADIRNWVNVNFWQVFGPAVLVLVGGTLVWRAIWGPGPLTPADDDTTGGKEYIRAFALLSGSEMRPTSEHFHGGHLTALMGGVKLNLTEARPIADVVTLDVFAMMGGIEIHAPADWLVTCRVMTVLGGYADNRRPSSGTPTKTLIIRGMVLMGGVEVKS